MNKVRFKLGLRDSLGFYLVELLGRLFQTEGRGCNKIASVERFQAFSADNTVAPQDEGRRVIRVENIRNRLLGTLTALRI